MKKGDEAYLNTPTLLRIGVGTNATHGGALLLHTAEVGTIALPMSLENIAVLRQQLAELETQLLQYQKATKSNH